MLPTADESAELKMALKHDRETDELAKLAQIHPQEADEALFEVEEGLDSAAYGSWVANRAKE